MSIFDLNYIKKDSRKNLARKILESIFEQKNKHAAFSISPKYYVNNGIEKSERKVLETLSDLTDDQIITFENFKKLLWYYTPTELATVLNCKRTTLSYYMKRCYFSKKYDKIIHDALEFCKEHKKFKWYISPRTPLQKSLLVCGGVVKLADRLGVRTKTIHLWINRKIKPNAQRQSLLNLIAREYEIRGSKLSNQLKWKMNTKIYTLNIFKFFSAS